MLIVAAVLLALVSPHANARATSLEISPWIGKDLPTAVGSAASKSRLTIVAKPGATLRLQAKNVSRGWLPAFCTPSVCAPVKVSVRIPHSGTAIVQFELIREAEDAPMSSGALIVTNDGASVTVPAASR